MKDVDQDVRAFLRLGFGLLALGALFWLSVIAGIVALIIHFS